MSDKCQTKNATLTFDVSCPSGYVIAGPTFKTTSSVQPVNGQLTLQYDYKTKSFPSYSADGTYAVTHSTGVFYKYRWVVKTMGNNIEVGTLSSGFEVNDGRFNLDGKLLQPGDYTLSMQVGDGCLAVIITY